MKDLNIPVFHTEDGTFSVHSFYLVRVLIVFSRLRSPRAFHVSHPFHLRPDFHFLKAFPSFVQRILGAIDDHSGVKRQKRSQAYMYAALAFLCTVAKVGRVVYAYTIVVGSVYMIQPLSPSHANLHRQPSIMSPSLFPLATHPPFTHTYSPICSHISPGPSRRPTPLVRPSRLHPHPNRTHGFHLRQSPQTERFQRDCGSGRVGE